MTQRNSSGYSDVLIGLQFGDEGKAKIVDMLAKDYDIVARFNGGSNAGHTIESGGKRLALRQVPSGVSYPNKSLYIGSGVVVNLVKLKKEIETLEAEGFSVRDRLHLSSQAAFLQPYHTKSESHFSESVGTTNNGIGPAYAGKALRTKGEGWLHLRLCDLVADKELCVEMMMRNDQAFGLTQDGYTELLEAFEYVSSCIESDLNYLVKRVRTGDTVLFEGAQSYMLDVARGTVPFVTSSHTGASAAYVGGDLPPCFHRKTFGIAKAIMSRVGPGPFHSEIGGEEAAKYALEGGGSVNTREIELSTYNPYELLSSTNELELAISLRMLSGEYGTVTGRPRRMGVLDLVQLRDACLANGVDELYLTKCDLLTHFETTKFGGIPLITDYNQNGAPLHSSLHGTVKTTPQVLPGFVKDISHVKSASDLPSELCALLSEIEQATECSVTGVGVGPDRTQMVHLGR